MCKVIIDSFDTEQQAVAFVDWLKKQFDSRKSMILTPSHGIQFVDWDGVDTSQSDNTQIVVNIVLDDDNYIDDN